MTRTIIVGDVHGMLSELHELLRVVSHTESDHLVMAGDLVDKGPDSAGVVRHLRILRENGFNITLVLGNHEEKHARYRNARAKAPAGQAIKMKGIEELETITAALSPADVAFLDSAVWFLKIPEHNAVVVHGGILPITETLDAEDKAMRGRLIRVRHVTGRPQTRLTVEYEFPFEVADTSDVLADAPVKADNYTVIRKVVRPVGEFVSLGQETPEDPFWADVYDGRFGHVFFGHSPFVNAPAPVTFRHATGLDLGAVHGNCLAAAILIPGQTHPSFVTIQASAKFASSLFEED